MKAYTFFLHRDAQRIPAFEIELFDTRARAVEHGRRLLTGTPECASVAVTDDEEEIASFDHLTLRLGPEHA